MPRPVKKHTLEAIRPGFDPLLPHHIHPPFMPGRPFQPNNLHNCNTEAQDAARAWATVMRRFPNAKLVSPATAGNGRPWLDAFFGNCSAMYGKDGCNISYVAVHVYTCSVDELKTYLEDIYSRYGNRPVWLTEFAWCGLKRCLIDGWAHNGLQCDTYRHCRGEDAHSLTHLFAKQNLFPQRRP
jgi:hypothetical protein